MTQREHYITPYTPEQNGIVERFFRSGRPQGEGGMCLAADMGSFIEAKSEIMRWISWYNEERPHQALSYQSSKQYQQHQQLAA